MVTIEPTGQILGARVRGIDLSRPLGDRDFATILLALGEHGVLHFPAQRLEAVELRDFSRRFGRIQATLTGRHHEPGMAEVGILSNVIENGEPIGITDAGQDWHTDMSYNPTIGFLNVLYAVKVPRARRQVLGATLFANMHAAYDGPRPGAQGAARRRDRHARLQQVLGEDAHAPGQLPRADDGGAAAAPAAVGAPGVPHASDHRRNGALLQSRLRDPHQRAARGGERARPRRAVRAPAPAEVPVHAPLDRRDVLMWDHIGTLHNAVADYGPDEHRLMKRCQVMADRVFDPAFVKDALAAGGVAPGALVR